MLEDLGELRTLRAIIDTGSLSAAGRHLGVSLAVVSKRLATLERRVGLRLVNRTTRRLSPTDDGLKLLTDIDHALEALDEAERQITLGRSEPTGTLRVTAPVSFGRRHVAPVLADLVRRHALLNVNLSLSNDLVDVTGGAFDVAIRIGTEAGTSATVLRLASSRLMMVAAPSYLDARGRPSSPEDLGGHILLRYADGGSAWTLSGPDGRAATVPLIARLRANSGDVIHDWCLGCEGIMLKSVMDVDGDVAAGRLEYVLPDWNGGDSPLMALFASGRHRPRKLQVFLEAMKARASTWAGARA